MIPYCICFFYFNLCSLLLLEVKNVAYHSKYTEQPILKAWTFKGITLSHFYSDKKISEQRMTFILLEVYRNTVTPSRWTVVRTKDSSTKSFQQPATALSF